MSWIVKFEDDDDDDDGDVFDAWIIRPSKSLGLFSTDTYPQQFSFRRSISFVTDFLISLSNFQEFMFLFVGRNLC